MRISIQRSSRFTSAVCWLGSNGLPNLQEPPVPTMPTSAKLLQVGLLSTHAEYAVYHNGPRNKSVFQEEMGYRKASTQNLRCSKQRRTCGHRKEYQASNQALVGLVSHCVSSAGDGWHPCAFKPPPKRRKRFVRQVLLPLNSTLKPGLRPQ